ncbi:MAG TPA: prepilin-type N-terminal cleavage/methylation domain-containing protein [Gemmatimonadales bacterium]|nr:prepilin-type N-terminal cleavage/methylation domain-containing protein [Gemmatimonadales bacterium]
MTSRHGFTLLELLVVVVIIGLLAAIAIPKFANSKDKAYMAQMKSDLRNLATAEEAFFYDSATYTLNFAQMNNYAASVGVTVVIREATPRGWSATASALNTYHQCALFSGLAAPVAPAAIEGQITCS